MYGLDALKSLLFIMLSAYDWFIYMKLHCKQRAFGRKRVNTFKKSVTGYI